MFIRRMFADTIEPSFLAPRMYLRDTHCTPLRLCSRWAISRVTFRLF